MSEVSSVELINDLSFCVIDLETTGGNHTKDKIIEIGMVKIKNQKIADEKSFLINPEIPIPDFIQSLTKISQNDVKDAPLIEDTIEEIIAFIGDDIIVAHNTSFDVPFLNSVLKRLDKEQLENKVICTNVMTKYLIPEILNSNLNYMSRLFNIRHSKAHRAHDDALATAELLLIYLDIFIQKGIKKVNQLYYPRNKFELDRVHLDQSKSLDDIVSFISKINSSTLITIKGERGLILAVIPLQSPSTEANFVREIISQVDWRIVTVRLIKPFIEGLFQFNNHLLKYPEDIKNQIVSYLNNRYVKEEETKKLDQIDFLLAHHLVSDQVVVYSFLHLNTNTKFLFKIPAQKKKLHNFLLSQINRFEKEQKGRRKHLIHDELKPLVENLISENTSDETKFLFLNRKDIKNEKEQVLRIIERFNADGENKYNFPTTHL